MVSLDKNVGDALLKLDLAPQSDPSAAQIERIIDEDRRRVRRWTRISITLWIVAAIGAMVIFVMGGLAFPFIAKLLMEEQHAAVSVASGSGKSDADKSAGTPKEGGSPLEDTNTPFTVLAKLVAMCLVIGTGAFMVLVFAGLATVLLLLRSRSATLRQINANLLQIAEQLKAGSGKAAEA
ncbi:MAG TPA: hypothetical protein VH107_10140 [Lacipirellulaceae bacterium]|jgi:hypothetical protein|nr:hypothetical protein [Lacipirellulaceae bacterium]